MVRQGDQYCDGTSEYGEGRRLLATLLGCFAGLEPAWTRVTKGALAVAGIVAVAVACDLPRYEGGDVAAAGAAGAAGNVYSIPACSGTKTTEHETVQPATYWTFDAANGNGDAGGINLIDLAGPMKLVPKIDEGHSAPTDDNPIRINGRGSSIALDGHQYYLADGIPSLADGGTIAAWISLSPQDFPSKVGESCKQFVWPIVSTLTPESSGLCGGYQLDIRQDCERDLQLVFTFRYLLTSASGSSREPKQLVLQLSKPSWIWGHGRWHHVAATYTQLPGDKSQVALHWDSESAVAGLHKTSPIFESQMGADELQFLIGTDAQAAVDPANGQKFVGNIDEVAAFNAVLGCEEIAWFTLEETTKPDGPGGCQWRASEEKEDMPSAGTSTITWGDFSASSAVASIHDEVWGDGVLSARLAQNRLTGFNSIRLRANIPQTPTKNGDFEVSLHAGDDQCTWFLVAEPGAADYIIDLSEPAYCQTGDMASCRFALSQVESISIRSSSEFPLYPYQDPLRYEINGLDLVHDSTRPEVETIGGTKGSRDWWCWRTEAFQRPTNAKATLSASTTGAIHGNLSGGSYSSPAVVADLGDRTIDLSECDYVNVFADVHVNGDGPLPSLFLVLQDRASWWEQYVLDATADAGHFRATRKNPNFVGKNDPEKISWLQFYPWSAES